MERQNINKLKNMHSPPAEHNFCAVHGNALKHYNSTQCKWKGLNAWQILTPLPDMPGKRQRSYISTFWTLPLSYSFTIFTSCGSKLPYQLFRESHCWETRSMMDAMTSDHMTWKSWPKDLTQDTANSGTWKRT